MGSIFIFRMTLFTIELACCIYAFVKYNQLKLTAFKWFPFYLLFIAISEALGHLMILTGPLKFVIFLHQWLIWPAQFLFFMGLLIWLIERKFKSWLLLFPLLYIFFFIVDNFILPDKRFYFLSLSICIGCLGLLILIFKYFALFIRSEGFTNFLNQLSFWVVGGLLIYFLGSLPFFGMFNVLADKYRQVHYVYFHIVLILSSLMYISFMIGIYLSSKNSVLKENVDQ